MTFAVLKGYDCFYASFRICTTILISFPCIEYFYELLTDFDTPVEIEEDIIIDVINSKYLFLHLLQGSRLSRLRSMIYEGLCSLYI